MHAGQAPDPTTGAIITPIYQTSTYVQDGLGRHKGYEYSRTQNPTREAAEANIAALEEGKAGIAFASGMAAIDAVSTLLESGDHVVVTENTYGGTFRLFEQVLRRYRLDFTYVDTSVLDQIAAALRPETRMIFVETPANPLLDLTDLAGLAELARPRDITVVVDNTFASPCVQQPLLLGADLVVHSTTKYLNGHADSIGGMVVAQRDVQIEWLRFVQNAAGAILSPFDAWLLLRGTKTLALRMAAHNAPDWRWPSSLPATPRWRECSTPACRTTHTMRWRFAKCAGSAGWWRSTSDRSTRPERCSKASPCSRSPRAWAALKA